MVSRPSETFILTGKSKRNVEIAAVRQTTHFPGKAGQRETYPGDKNIRDPRNPNHPGKKAKGEKAPGERHRALMMDKDLELYSYCLLHSSENKCFEGPPKNGP